MTDAFSFGIAILESSNEYYEAMNRSLIAFSLTRSPVCLLHRESTPLFAFGHRYHRFVPFSFCVTKHTSGYRLELFQERAVQDRLGGVVHDAESAAVANQRRMNADPFEMFLMNMGATADAMMPDVTVRSRRPAASPDEDQEEDPGAAIQCRQS